MILPESVYAFRMPKDTAGPMIEQIIDEKSSSAAGTTVTTTLFTCPGDRITVLTSLGIFTQAGAAQVAQFCRLQVIRSGQNISILGHTRLNTVVPERLEFAWTGQLWLHPGWVLQARGYFDAGAAANTVAGSYTGFLIPRANVS